METIRAALRHAPRVAVSHDSGNYRYGQLLRSAIRLADTIPPPTDASHPHCVAVMAEPGPDYVAATWAAWLRGAISVPLCPAHADGQLQYFFEDSRANCVLASESHLERMVGVARPFGAEVLQAESRWGLGTNAGESGDEGVPGVDGSVRAAGAQPLSPLAADPLVAAAVELPDSTPSLIIYTSGTTGKPKGAVHTHGSLGAQILALQRAWEFTEQDRVLHVLPLHHIHGIVNGLLTTLASGGAVEMRPRFSVHDVWERLERETDPISVFHGVPTMYSFLAAAADPKGRGDAAAEFDPAKKRAAHRLRFAAAGSSAAPAPLHAAWKALSGQTLLERYGMTETGMTLGNPLHGERRVGTVGVPFPFVEAKIEAPEGGVGAAAGGSDESPDGRVGGAEAGCTPGELLVRGPQLFKEYLNRPEATAEAFTPDGYFRTGDVAITSGSPPYFTLLGRASIDVIKRGGYKISALEIESALLQHPALREMAVFPLPSDDAYGEDIVAVAVPREADDAPSLDQLREFAKGKLAPYQLPTKLVYVDAIERNAMGKVNKKALRKKLFELQ